MPKKMPGLAIVIADRANKKAKSAYPGNPNGGNGEEDMQAELDLAAGDVMSAVEKKDTAALSSALKSFVELCY